MKIKITFSEFLSDRLGSLNISSKDVLVNSFQNYLMKVVESQRSKKTTAEFLKYCLVDPLNNIYKLGDFYYLWQNKTHILYLKNTNYSYEFYDNGSLTWDTILFLSSLNIKNEIQELELKIQNTLSYIYKKIPDLIKIFKFSECEIHLNTQDVFIENLMDRKGKLKFEGRYYDKYIELNISWKDLLICSRKALDDLMLMLPFLNIYFRANRLLITYDENLDIFQFC